MTLFRKSTSALSIAKPLIQAKSTNMWDTELASSKIGKPSSLVRSSDSRNATRRQPGQNNCAFLLNKKKKVEPCGFSSETSRDSASRDSRDLPAENESWCLEQYSRHFPRQQYNNTEE